MPRFLVVGATGTIGSQVAAQLAAAGASVRALVRNPSASLPAGVQSIHGDLAKPDTLDRAVDGIDAVFLVWTAPADTAEAALDAITRRVRRIVYLSAPIKTRHPFFQVSLPNPSSELHSTIEGHLERSRCEWTIVRPGMFAANARHFWGPQLHAGDIVRWPYLEAPTAPIDERDVAALAVLALTSDGHGGAEYVITGPDSVTQREQIATLGRVTGRAVTIVEETPEEWRRVMSGGAPEPPPFLDYLLRSWNAAIGQPTFITSTFEELTGRRPRTFLQWATDHADEFRRSDRTP